MAQGNDHHAEQNHESHQTHGQRDRGPLEGVLRICFGHGSCDRVVFAVGSGESAGTEAGRRVPWDTHAGAAVEAGSGRAGIGGPVAVTAFVSRGAGADVVVDAVVARATVSAGVVRAVVDVDLAALASEARSTATHARAPQDHTQAICGSLAQVSMTNLTYICMHTHTSGSLDPKHTA